jgi:hypothetical protein
MLTIDSPIQLIKDFSCASSTTTRFSCVVISSGNYITEHVFTFNPTTVSVKEMQQIIYNPYRDFSAEKILLKGTFFVVNGFSSQF